MAVAAGSEDAKQMLATWLVAGPFAIVETAASRTERDPLALDQLVDHPRPSKTAVAAVLGATVWMPVLRSAPSCR